MKDKIINFFKGKNIKVSISIRKNDDLNAYKIILGFDEYTFVFVSTGSNLIEKLEESIM